MGMQPRLLLHGRAVCCTHSAALCSQLRPLLNAAVNALPTSFTCSVLVRLLVVPDKLTTLHCGQVYIFGRGNVKPADKRYSRVRNDYALHFDTASELESCGALAAHPAAMAV